MTNDKHKGPHCAGSCEGAAYLIKIRNLKQELAETLMELSDCNDWQVEMRAENDGLKEQLAESENVRLHKIKIRSLEQHIKLLNSLRPSMQEIDDKNTRIEALEAENAKLKAYIENAYTQTKGESNERRKND